MPGPLKNQRHEEFSKFLALSSPKIPAGQAYVKAGYSPNGADQSASALLKRPEILLRIAELSSKVTEAVIEDAQMTAQVRLKYKQVRYLELMQIKAKRAEESQQRVTCETCAGGGKDLAGATCKRCGGIGTRAKSLVANAPGSETGWVILRDMRKVGEAVIPFYGIDTGLTSELSRLESEIEETLGDGAKGEALGRAGTGVNVQVVIMGSDANL